MENGSTERTPAYVPGLADLTRHFTKAPLVALLDARTSMRCILADLDAAITLRQSMPQPAPERDAALLDASEVARRLHVTKANVWRAVRRGKLASVGVGRYRRFRESDLQAFIANGRR